MMSPRSAGWTISHPPASTDRPDADFCTTDSCLGPGTCGAACRHAAPACSGVLVDTCCPAGCDFATDADCPLARCGDGTCAGRALGEDCLTCPADCKCKGKACAKACCGDGTCFGETALTCPIDCL